MKKVAVVTGSSRGIGLDIAKTLVSAGWEVCGISRTRPVEKVAFKTILFDLYKIDQISKLVGKLPGKVDLLVNNAGAAYRKGIEDINLDDFVNIIDLNFKTPVLLTKHLLSRFSKGALVINISSDASCMNLPGYILYSASKAGINRFTSTLAEERKDIRSFAILPSLVDTPLVRKSRGDDPEIERFLKPKNISDVILEMVNGKYKSGDLVVVTNDYLIKWWKGRDKYKVVNVDRR